MGKKTPSIEEIIKKAVDAGLEAGRLSAERSARNAFKDTERRLYALPTLRQKLEVDKERLDEIKTYGPRSRSKSITRFGKSSVRLTPEEILEAVVTDMEATIAADEYEIERMEKALSIIADDEYVKTVTGRYIEGLTDEEIADDIHCDTSTVWRNRKRLVQRLSVWLYGAKAVS